MSNIDDDSRGFTLSPTNGLETTEAGGTDTFTVRLNSEPTADVTLLLSSSNTDEGTIDKATLDFTALNWDQEQTVTITGADDNVDDNDQVYSIITAAATGGDYAGTNPSDVSVTNQDDDAVGFTISPINGLTTTEAGGTDTFTIQLNSEPSAPVSLMLLSSNITEGTIDKASLDFTASDWDQPQTVTVTGVDDNVDDSNQVYSIITSTASGGDYAGLNPADISVTNQDDDTAGFTLSG
ncbi:MAG: calcium-binding protein, partial [Gammaproteobacteria bacterium]|nr:calcium-binding protein [Gammaproteobacteria bacterium]